MENKTEKNLAVEFSIPYPENMGRLNDPDGSAWIKGLCGDTIEIYLIIKDDKVTKAAFDTDGCNISRACGSAAANLAEGKMLKDVLRLSPADIIDMWVDIPQENIHCTILAISTLHKAVANYLQRKSFRNS